MDAERPRWQIDAAEQGSSIEMGFWYLRKYIAGKQRRRSTKYPVQQEPPRKQAARRATEIELEIRAGNARMDQGHTNRVHLLE
jgi:hypothetical protein